ncbi:hypothetical protein [Kitasatospora azatica]|uniref:hypothetical protein n=1 Tax=Kitasatospora azatica TaxID=58347 RepID=UPI00055DA471|nr:hypothetical protein [Kitasatospora azatica]
MTEPYFEPTHVVPPGGLPTWSAPEPGKFAARLDPLLPVQLTEIRGDWAQVVCANGWTTWLDGRLLIALPRSPVGAGELLPGEDPRPLLARLEAALAAYREHLDDLAEGRSTAQEFGARVKGLRIGAVVDGAESWLLDLAEKRWYYCDGQRLRPYAVVTPVDGAVVTPVDGAATGSTDGEP